MAKPPFLRFRIPLFQSESSCTVFRVKMSFTSKYIAYELQGCVVENNLLFLQPNKSVQLGGRVGWGGGGTHRELAPHPFQDGPSVLIGQVARQAGAYPGFCSMKRRLGVFLLPPWMGC